MLDILTIGKIYTESRYTVKGSQIVGIKERFTGEYLHVAINGRILKAKTGIVAAVGNDAYGITELLERYDVEYSDLILSKEKTGRVIRMDNRYVFEGANKFLTVTPALVKKAKIVHVSDDPKMVQEIMKMDTRCILSTSLETEADIIFSEEDGPGNRIILGEKIRFGGKAYDAKLKKGGKSAFIAGFLTRYAKTQKADSSMRYALSAMNACKDTILGAGTIE
jgi:hypothetical protein